MAIQYISLNQSQNVYYYYYYSFNGLLRCPLSERWNQSGFNWGKRWRGFGMALSSAPDNHTDTSSFNFSVRMLFLTPNPKHWRNAMRSEAPFTHTQSSYNNPTSISALPHHTSASLLFISGHIGLSINIIFSMNNRLFLSVCCTSSLELALCFSLSITHQVLKFQLTFSYDWHLLFYRLTTLSFITFSLHD